MASVLQIDPNRREYELIATNRNSAEDDRMNASTIVADISNNNNNLLLEDDVNQQHSETASLVNNVQSPNHQEGSASPNLLNSSTTNLLLENDEITNTTTDAENVLQLLLNIGLCLIGGCCVVGGHIIIFVLVLLFVKGNGEEGGDEGGKIGIWTASNLLLLVGVLLCLSISCFRALSMRMMSIWRLIRNGLSRRSRGGGVDGEETAAGGSNESDIVQESRRLLREQLLLRELVRIGFLPESEEHAMNQRHQNLNRRLQLAMEDRDFTAEDYDRLLELDQDSSGTRGLTESQIQRLPQAKISNCSHELKQTLLLREKCPICLDKYVEENQVMTLPCLHRFHSDCISTWLKKKGNCPVCQTAISF